MDRIMTISPSWDKRDPNPSKNYGIHNSELRMVLRGELGAVQFVMGTGWFLKHLRYGLKNTLSLYPMAMDLGYHSPKPMYDGQLPIGVSHVYDDNFDTTGQTKGIATPCEYLDGKPCYYDGSGLNAEKVLDILIEKGDEAVWEYLENYYCEIFGELK